MTSAGDYPMHGFHNHCSHILLHCMPCNLVYCSKCGQEWGRQNWYVTYPGNDLNTTTVTTSGYSTVLCSHG